MKHAFRQEERGKVNKQMTEKELPNGAIAISQKASVDIGTVRKNLQELGERLASASDTAREIARNELCRSLVQRLELAEREAVELAEMIALADTSS